MAAGRGEGGGRYGSQLWTGGGRQRDTSVRFTAGWHGSGSLAAMVQPLHPAFDGRGGEEEETTESSGSHLGRRIKIKKNQGKKNGPQNDKDLFDKD